MNVVQQDEADQAAGSTPMPGLTSIGNTVYNSKLQSDVPDLKIRPQHPPATSLDDDANDSIKEEVPDNHDSDVTSENLPELPPNLLAKVPTGKRIYGACVRKQSRGVTIYLLDNDVWQTFCSVGNEMIITKKGRRMFPVPTFIICDLDPEKLYDLSLELNSVDNHVHKYINGKWTPSKEGSYLYPTPAPGRNACLHHCSPNTGFYWMKEPVSFATVKISNNLEALGTIVLQSMRKYVMFLIIDELKATAGIKIRLPETVFVAVTQYQNDEVTKKKIEHNPFANAFRLSSNKSKDKDKAKRHPVDADSEDESKPQEVSSSSQTPTTSAQLHPDSLWPLCRPELWCANPAQLFAYFQQNRLMLHNLLPSHSDQNLLPSHSGQNLLPSHSDQNLLPSHSGQNLLPSNSGQNLLPSHSGPNLLPSNSGQNFLPSHSGRLNLNSPKQNLSIENKIASWPRVLPPFGVGQSLYTPPDLSELSLNCRFMFPAHGVNPLAQVRQLGELNPCSSLDVPLSLVKKIKPDSTVVSNEYNNNSRSENVGQSPKLKRNVPRELQNDVSIAQMPMQLPVGRALNETSPGLASTRDPYSKSVPDSGFGPLYSGEGLPRSNSVVPRGDISSHVREWANPKHAKRVDNRSDLLSPSGSHSRRCVQTDLAPTEKPEAPTKVMFPRNYYSPMFLANTLGVEKPDVILKNEDQWATTNVAIVSSSGRLMFPFISLAVDRLHPDRQYSFSLMLSPCSNYFFEYKQHEWVPSLPAWEEPRDAVYPHPDNPKTGREWGSEVVFDKLRLSKLLKGKNLLKLELRRQYLPRVIVETDCQLWEYPLRDATFITVKIDKSPCQMSNPTEHYETPSPEPLITQIPE